MIVYVASRDYAFDGPHELLGAATTPEGARIVAEGHLSAGEAAKVRDWCEPSTDSGTYAMIGRDYSIDVRVVHCRRKEMTLA